MMVNEVIYNHGRYVSRGHRLQADIHFTNGNANKALVLVNKAGQRKSLNLQFSENSDDCFDSLMVSAATILLNAKHVRALLAKHIGIEVG